MCLCNAEETMRQKEKEVKKCKVATLKHVASSIQLFTYV